MSIATAAKPRSRSKRAHIERRIDVDGISIRYIEAGIDNPEPPIVLLHGFQAGADIWYPHAFPALSARRHVVALDLPGFAYSGKLDSYSTEAYANFLHSFLDTLGYDQVDLVGHSMGGQIAVATAAAYLERVRRLVLVSSAGLPRTESPIAALALLTDRSTFHLRLYPTVIRLATRVRAGRACMNMVRTDSVYGLLSDLPMPTLVVWGSRDRLVPLEHATIFARAIPHARLAIMRGCGHMPFYQKPRQFERLVLSFLNNP
jgi:pimeloyl-ACP methyl ester carboxylesterase